MIRKVIDYIRNDLFEVVFEDGYVSIVNYLAIGFMENNKVVVRAPFGEVAVLGNNLVVVKMLDDEILIKGEILNIEFRRNHAAS